MKSWARVNWQSFQGALQEGISGNVIGQTLGLVMEKTCSIGDGAGDLQEGERAIGGRDRGPLQKAKTVEGRENKKKTRPR